MLIVHRNNRMELLLAELGDVLSERRSHVFQPEVIVVQSLGMERWLSMGLANRFGVWANAQHPFPRTFIEAVSDVVIGPLQETERYTRPAMAFHLAQILGDLPESAALAPLANYLAARGSVVARLELAEQLADAFDQVQIYRPDWIVAWESQSTPSETNDFRPTLFRLMSTRLGKHHVPARMACLVARLEQVDFDSTRLPERISLFGVATLPPLFIRVVVALARHVPVHWFLLTASREYLGAERDRREIVRDAATKEAEFGDESSRRFLQESSNRQPLFASFGRIMRDVGLLLERDCNYVEVPSRGFVESEPTSVLRTMQADLCALRRRGTTGEAQRLPLRAEDRSLEVHACHGPRREIEVLRQVLLDAFERDSSLHPEDVIVLLRDVETYAPLVEAVFASERGRVGHIPYTLSDRMIGVGNPLVESILALLDLVRLRVTATELMRVVELEPLGARFGLDSDDLAKIRGWLQQLHVTWGVDIADRKRDGATGQREHTIRFGLSRLLLGATLESSVEHPWQGLLPLDVEGDEAELAGRFVECAEAIFLWRERFTLVRSFGDWYRTIQQATQELFAVAASDAWQLADLLQTVSQIGAEAERAAFAESVPAQVLTTRIRRHYENLRSAQSLLSGGVTFCAMLPMRGIPARIVAMVGLDDGKFPRPTPRGSFDEVGRSAPRPGDRVGRDEDRHLFLETLLAARDRLIITYQGRDPRDDSPRARSVLVDELLAVVDESFELSGQPGVCPSQRLVIVHPLHAHSPRYFDGSDSRLLERDPRQYAAALALERSRFLPEPGMRQALRPIRSTEIEIDVLERFWSAPAEYFYQVRLGAALERDRPDLEALDPTDLDSLGRYQLTIEQFQAISGGRSLTDAFAEWTAKGQRPFSTLGKVVYDEQLAVTQQLHAVASELFRGGRAKDLDCCVQIADVEIKGVVCDRFANGRVDWSPAKISGKHRVVAWLRHLLLNASGAPAETWLLRRAPKADESVHLERLAALDAEEACHHLLALVALHDQGQQAPLAFFPDLAWDYASRIDRGERHDGALDRALYAYGDPLATEQDDYQRPVGPREVIRLFGAEPPLTDAWPARFGIEGFPSFAELSRIVFSPYLACAKVVEASEIVGDIDVRAGSNRGRS
jgi:exodeoxyribonuclease V gamma subunit